MGADVGSKRSRARNPHLRSLKRACGGPGAVLSQAIVWEVGVAGFTGIFIPGYMSSAMVAKLGCKPLLGVISVHDIPHGPVYSAGFAGYITLGACGRSHCRCCSAHSLASGGGRFGGGHPRSSPTSNPAKLQPASSCSRRHSWRRRRNRLAVQSDIPRFSGGSAIHLPARSLLGLSLYGRVLGWHS